MATVHKETRALKTIANHTWYHNARTDLYGKRMPWVTRPLEDYSQFDMADEIGQAVDWLDTYIGAETQIYEL